MYILLNNIGGDGKDVWPYVGKIDRNGHLDNDNLHFDISKLRQWDIVFRHAQQKGIVLHLVLGESERANKVELDNSVLGVERRLYYREMVARFAYHNAILWNLCEEYNWPGARLPDELMIEWATYLKELDPYQHPVTVHNSSRVFSHWEKTLFGQVCFDFISFQYTNNRLRNVPDYQMMTERLRYGSAASGRKLAVMMDETQRATPVDEDAYSISENGGIPEVRLGQQRIRKDILYPVEGKFTVRSYNPRTGEFEGKTPPLTGGKCVPVGPVSSEPDEDWLVLIEKADNRINVT